MIHEAGELFKQENCQSDIFSNCRIQFLLCMYRTLKTVILLVSYRYFTFAKEEDLTIMTNYSHFHLQHYQHNNYCLEFTIKWKHRWTGIQILNRMFGLSLNIYWCLLPQMNLLISLYATLLKKFILKITKCMALPWFFMKNIASDNTTQESPEVLDDEIDLIAVIGSHNCRW